MIGPSTVRGVTTNEVVDSYWKFLWRNNYQLQLARLKQRLNTVDAGSAEAEAMVFSFLWSAKLQPDIYEDPSHGGPDLICAPPAGSFVVEVTSLESKAVSRRSHLPEHISGRGSGAFGLLTNFLAQKATAKASQLAKVPFPRLLAITSCHDFSGILLDRLAARNLLISDPAIRVRLGDFSGSGKSVTDLKHSVFLRFDESTSRVTSRRRSISAILLVSISGRQSDVVGILHPDPFIPFSPLFLPTVPFIRITNWPITGDQLGFEWVGNQSERATFVHKRIQ